MYNLQKNNYHQKPKSSIVYTPKEVSQFIFQLLSPLFPKKQGKIILDPCSGMGSLLAPWKKFGFETIGIDIDENSTAELKLNFLDKGLLTATKPFEPWYQSMRFDKHFLILCNPPFNGYGNKLGSEVWLAKIIELFGKEIPLVLFVPMGFRLNSKKSGKRWTKFTKQEYPSITSIISLPRNIFKGVEFHSEILIFNLPNLQPHYFYHHEI